VFSAEHAQADNVPEKALIALGAAVALIMVGWIAAIAAAATSVR